MLLKKKRIPIVQFVLYGFLPSFVKKIIYRLKGYKIGNNVSIGLGSIVIGKDVEIKDNTNIGFLSIIKAKKVKIDRFVTIGSFVYIDIEQLEIGEDSKIREHVYIAGIITPESKLTLGKRCMILQYSFLNPTKQITLGNDCGIGGSCKLFTHGSYLSILEGYPVTFAPIIIGNNVWIAWDVFILPGVSIGNDVVIGACSLITRDIPSNCIVSGNPAKVIVKKFPLPLSTQEKSDILDKIFIEFEDYLIHNMIPYSKEIITEGLILKCKTNKKIKKLIYIKLNLDIKEIVKTDILVLNNKIMELCLLYKKCSSAMTICLESKERIGTSDIGEEFVKFLSRYGIRFNRLD
jgi:acetyltransferase-like isoleucine patch superfamily enzyme